MTFNIGDKVFHNSVDGIFGIVIETNLFRHAHMNDTCARVRWFPKHYLNEDLDSTAYTVSYHTIEPCTYFKLVEPAIIEYKYDQSGDTEEDI